jgi:flagellar basal body-associated protein FliL
MRRATTGVAGSSSIAFAGTCVMADKEKKGEEKSPAAAPAAEKKAGGGGGGGGLLKSTPALLGVVMVVEAAVLFGGFKMLGGGPKDSHGAEPHDGKHATDDKHAKPDPKTLVEVAVLEFKAPNRVNGNSYLYDVKIYVSAKPDNQKALTDVITARSATIQDRVRTIISQSDPSKLGGGTEPGLETLRRQVKYQLDEIVGEGMVEEVLIPKCIPYRSEF